jgi:lysophospholipase L1-like esterase
VTRRAQDLLLIALALVAALTIYFAFATVRSAPTPERTGGELTSTPGADGTPSALAPSTEAAPEGDTPEGDDTARVTDAPEGEPPGDPVGAARQALSGGEDVTVAVLGDSTSNERSEWVHLWAETLAEDRPVSISHWNEADGAAYNEPDVLSEDGEAGAVTIWSGSQAGVAARFPVERLEAMVPEEPGFVIFSYGHNNTLENIDGQLSELRSALTDEFGELPIICILQNPQLDDQNADVREAVAAWAEENGAGTIDVASEFYTPRWPLLVDEIHPSAEGQQIWADTVADALS